MIFEVVMLDRDGVQMENVGYSGDPWRVFINETNGEYIDTMEVAFTPGKEFVNLSDQLLLIF